MEPALPRGEAIRLRRTGLVLLAGILLISGPASAATQDELLTQYNQFGDEDLFDDHPSLFVIRLAAIAQLQTGTISSANLTAFENLLAQLNLLKDSIDDLASRQGANLHPAFQDLLGLRSSVASVTNSPLQPLYDLLLVGVDRVLALYQSKLEASYPTLNQTTDQLRLLKDAVDAAQFLQDAVGYGRLEAARQALQAEYDADMSEARDVLEQAHERQDTPASSYVSFGFVSLYAHLLESKKDLSRAQALYEEHGETERFNEAQALQAEIAERSHRYQVNVLAFVGAYAVLLWSLLLLGTQQITAWAHVRHRARLGDEMALEG